MTSPSLRRRLIVWLIGAALALGALALADTRREAIGIAQGVSDRVLAGAAMAIAERITMSEDGGVDVMVPFSALEMLSSTAQDLVFYRVDGPVGFITGYEDLPASRPEGRAPVYADIAYHDTLLRAATLRRFVSGDGGTLAFDVTVAESTLARSELAQAILLRSAARLALLIGLLALTAWLVVTLTLRPLGQLGSSFAARGAADLRPITAVVPHEVAPLVDAVNQFMLRLGNAVAAMKRFTANANHQIRTPLATARTHLALAGRGGAGRGESLTKAEQALVRAERVLEQLLLLARIDAEQARPPPAPVDLAALARDIATECLPQARMLGQDLGYDGPEAAMIEAEPVLLAEAIRNLADNAMLHNPPGTIITIEVRAAGPDVTVTVRDTGLGTGAGLAALLDAGGAARPGVEHGLGLTIVRDIAAITGAEVGVGAGIGGRGVGIALRFAARSQAPMAQRGPEIP